MKLIAKKPCSFGGRKFYIDQEIPQELVVDAALQERLGVLVVIADEEQAGGTEGKDRTGGTGEELFTREQADDMVSRAVAAVRQEYEQKIFDGAEAELFAEGIGDVSGFDGKVIVAVTSREDGDTAETMTVPLSVSEAQDVFSIMQMTVLDAEKAIDEITEENVLIVLHACDSRTGVKKAASKRADTLIPTNEETKAPTGGNEATEGTTEPVQQPAG